MLSVVKSYIQAKLNLSERGAEMVEYAIVLACIAAVGAVFYATSAPKEGAATNTLYNILDGLWKSIQTNVPK